MKNRSRKFLLATTALTMATMAVAIPPAAEAVVPGLSAARERLRAAEEARFRRIGLAIRYSNILDSAARALADDASTISDDSLETHYATPQPLAAGHAPTLLATQRQLLTETGARFVIVGGWVTAIAPVTGFPLGVTLADVQEAARGIGGMEIDLYSSTGRIGSGGGIQRPELPAAHSTALATVGAGVGRSVPFVRWNGLTAVRSVTQQRWVPCPAGQIGGGLHQERTFQRQHFADGTVTDPAGGWTTQIDSCSPEFTTSFSDFRACPGGGPGDIRWTVTRRTMQDPSNPWSIVIRDTNGPEENRCSFSGPGTTGTVSERMVYDQVLACPAGSTGTDGRHRFYLVTARLAGQGHSITGATVEGRRIRTQHDAPSCRWPRCGTPAQTDSINISGVPADMATVSWTTTSDACPRGPGDPDDGTGRVTGIDVDGDGDIDYTFTQAHNNNIDYDEDDVITVQDDDLTPSDFNHDNNDDETSDHEGCFLTTAVVTMRGEADDGSTLTVLRGFRDGWLAETRKGRAMIAEYYSLAPGIVSAIPEGHAEWAWIEKQVDASRDAILAGLNDQALAIYAGMIRRLRTRWL